MSIVYIIDANALIEASKQYNMTKQLFSEIWDTLENMVNDGELISSSEVYDELFDEDIKEWASKNKKAFIPLNKTIQDNVKKVLKDYPTMIKIRSKGNSNADPFLVATAMTIDDSVIVTNEKLGDESSKNFKIPNVCKKLNIECINLHQFMDRILE